jgi:hypothetical protein
MFPVQFTGTVPEIVPFQWISHLLKIAIASVQHTFNNPAENFSRGSVLPEIEIFTDSTLHVFFLKWANTEGYGGWYIN